MNKTWNAPELQFIHKFANLQVLASHILPENIPLELVECFQKAKELKTAIPNPVICGLTVLRYEENNPCVPQSIWPQKLSLHQLVNRGREKIMLECEKIDLQEMYSTVYGTENIHYVPLQYTQYSQIRVFQ